MQQHTAVRAEYELDADALGEADRRNQSRQDRTRVCACEGRPCWNDW